MSVFPVCVPVNYKSCLHHGNNCKSSGKTPLVQWQKYQNQFASVEEIVSWEMNFGNVNLALVTGQLSGIVVIDADSSDARKFVEDRGIEPGPRALTGKIGGTHFYCQHPGYEIKNFVGKVNGLDFRGDGGFVLLAGSKHANGNFYRWADDTKELPLPPIPDWMQDFFVKPEVIIAGHGWIAQELQNLHEGTRNVTMFRIASWLRRFGASKEDIFYLLRPHALGCGLSIEEIEIITSSASRYTPDFVDATNHSSNISDIKLVRGEDDEFKFVRS